MFYIMQVSLENITFWYGFLMFGSGYCAIQSSYATLSEVSACSWVILFLSKSHHILFLCFPNEAHLAHLQLCRKEVWCIGSLQDLSKNYSGTNNLMWGSVLGQRTYSYLI